MTDEPLARLQIFLTREDIDAIEAERQRLLRDGGLKVSTSQAAAALIRGALPGRR